MRRLLSLTLSLTLVVVAAAAAQTHPATLAGLARRVDALEDRQAARDAQDARGTLLGTLRAGRVVVDARNRAVAPLHPGCVAGLSDDGGWLPAFRNGRWEQMSDADYAAWMRRDPALVAIVDDEPVLDAAGIAGLNARTPARAAMIRAAAPGKLVFLYGPFAGEYWPFVNGDDPNFQPARDAIAARNDALLPAMAACDGLLAGIYLPYPSAGPDCDTRSFADPAAERRRRIGVYVAGAVSELRRLRAKLGGDRPIAVMAWACDALPGSHRPISAADADAVIDAVPADVNMFLWGDGNAEGGIGDRMLARAVRR